MQAPFDWPIRHFAGSPWFAALHPILEQLPWDHFPQTADWASLPAPMLPFTSTGQRVQFVDPATLAPKNYEARIAHSGQVATRPANWHDAFNALCWLAWPLSKAALNACHVAQQTATDSTGAAQATQRGRNRDAATLFDESGLVLATDQPAVWTALQSQDWHTLFVGQRTAWESHHLPLIFGHALLEKGLAPYIGLVGRCWVLPVSSACLQLPPRKRLAELDRQLSTLIATGGLHAPSAIPPLPLLGIPGWWPEQDAAFYADRSHFRQRSSQAAP